MARHSTTPQQQSVRVLKVGERVRHILSELLARGEAHDETLTAHAVSVTEVRMTPDLRNAAAYVKPLLGATKSHAEMQAARLLTLQAAWKMDQLHAAGKHYSDARVEIDCIAYQPR